MINWLIKQIVPFIIGAIINWWEKRNRDYKKAQQNADHVTDASNMVNEPTKPIEPVQKRHKSEAQTSGPLLRHDPVVSEPEKIQEALAERFKNKTTEKELAALKELEDHAASVKEANLKALHDAYKRSHPDDN